MKKYVIRIKRGQLQKAKHDLGFEIAPDRMFVRFLPSRDIYTSKRMATRFDSSLDAYDRVYSEFEKVISVHER